MTALVEEALRARLAGARGARKSPVRLPIFPGTGLREGISLDCMADVYDRMDGLE